MAQSMTGGGNGGQTGGGNGGQTGGGNGGQTGGGNGGQTGGGNGGQTGGGNGGQTGGGNGGQTGGGHVQAAVLASAPKPPTNVGPTVMAYRQINFKIQQQEQPEWCWAAVAASVEKYYSPDSTLKQCEIVNKVLPKDYPGFKLPEGTSCLKPEDCDLPAELETALKGIYKWRTTLDQLQAPGGSILATGALTFEDVRREIDNGRPICVGISWKGGGGHFVVIRGYRILSSGARQVDVADPLNPSARVDFDEFTYAYFGHGEWTETDLVRNDRD